MRRKRRNVESGQPINDNMLGFIKALHTDKNEVKVILRLCAVFLAAFVFYLIGSYYVIRILSLNDVKSYLKNTASSVVQDFKYSNGVWNTNEYLSNVKTPSEIPLYIFSLDGFLIDRMNVIHGFLDTSNFVYASSFPKPKTFISPVGEDWRIFSYSIKRNGVENGVILLGYFDPAGRTEKELDSVLLADAQKIDSKIKVTDEVLDVSAVIDKEVNPNVSFEVVDTFNRSYKSVAGPPAYIDKSYLQDVFRNTDFSIIQDRITGAKYLMHVEPILADGQKVGVVVLGKGLDQMEQILQNQIKLSVLVGLLSIILFAIVSLYVYRHDIKDFFIKETSSQNPLLSTYSKIRFDASEGKICIDEKPLIDIPLRTKQHIFCSLFFKSPKRKWDTDELAEKLGLSIEANKQDRHVVYDSVMAINAKFSPFVGKDLIKLRAKTYFINPDLLKFLPQ